MQKTNKTRLRSILIGTAIGITLYIALIFIGDKNKILSAIARVDATIWVGILALSLANYLARYIRWHQFILHLGFNVPKLDNLLYYISGFALTLTPGKVGETIRSIYLTPHGVQVSQSIAIFFVERFLDLIIVLVLTTFIATTYENYYFLLIGALFVIAVIYTLINQHLWLDKIVRKYSQQLGEKLATALHHIISTFRCSSTLINSTSSFTGLVLGLVAWTTEGIALYMILSALDVQISIPVAIGIYSISLLAGAISFIPGGLGSTEAAMVLLITLMGTDVSTATAATIICRVATLWFAIALGVSVLMYLEFRNKQTAQRT